MDNRKTEPNILAGSELIIRNPDTGAYLARSKDGIYWSHAAIAHWKTWKAAARNAKAILDPHLSDAPDYVEVRELPAAAGLANIVHRVA